MGDRTKIEWADATWNPIYGCSAVSAGCTNCYAIRTAMRFQHQFGGTPLVRMSGKRPVWTGQVVLAEARIDLPLRWTRPRRIFVTSQSDLFHESVPDAWIDRVFAVMACAPQHVFQVLSKRPERMRSYMNELGKNRACWRTDHQRIPYSLDLARYGGNPPWPLPNVWLGVSVEDQATADERIPILLSTPAAVRWISAEPLLGPIDISPWLFGGDPPCPACPKDVDCDCGWQTRRELGQPHLSWVVVGGESGPGARPFNLEWARCVAYQCRTADTPVFVKQLGTNPVVTQRNPAFGERDAPFVTTDRKGAVMAEWPEDLRAQEYPDA